MTLLRTLSILRPFDLNRFFPNYFIQALQDKAEMEKNARRKNSSAAAHIKHPAMYKSVLNVENKLSGRATSPYRSPNKSPSKNNTQNSSFSPNSGAGGHNIFKSNGVSSSVGELELFHVDLSSPAKAVEMISFHSFVRVSRSFTTCLFSLNCLCLSWSKNFLFEKYFGLYAWGASLTF